MAFFTLEGPGLTIFPNHRLVHDVEDFSLARLLADVSRWFEVGALPDPVRPTPGAIFLVSGTAGATLRLRPGAAEQIPWPRNTSAAWRRLAVSVLHEGILKPFLGKGWKYGVEIDRTGGVAVSELEESIRQSILIILGTAPGERVMRPTFGCDIHELLYALKTASTGSLITRHLPIAIDRFEHCNFTPGEISMILWVASRRTSFKGAGSSGLSAAVMDNALPAAKAPDDRAVVIRAGGDWKSIVAGSCG